MLLTLPTMPPAVRTSSPVFISLSICLCSVSLAVEAVLGNEIPSGVTAAPHQTKLVSRWLDQAEDISDHFVLIDHLN